MKTLGPKLPLLDRLTAAQAAQVGLVQKNLTLSNESAQQWPSKSNPLSPQSKICKSSSRDAIPLESNEPKSKSEVQTSQGNG